MKAAVILLIVSVCSYFGYKHFLNSPEKACQFFPDFPAENGTFGRDFFIAHGGGGIDSYTYTNSVEAVMKSIQNGYRFIELDLALTTDGKIVGVHDWAHFNKLTGHEDLGDKPLSFKEFKSRKIHDTYTPITFIEIEKIFTDNPDLILVTDKITDFQSIVSTFSFKNRIIVEIFSREDYDRALKEGIVHPMLSAQDTDLTSNYIKEKNVRMVAVHSGLLSKYPSELEALKNAGLCIFAFSSNDEQFIRKNLKAQRATAIYTDFWDLKSDKCSQSSAECTTY